MKNSYIQNQTNLKAYTDSIKDLKKIYPEVNLDELNEKLPASYKSAKLSPFPCRIQNGRYTLNGRDYEFANKFTERLLLFKFWTSRG